MTVELLLPFVLTFLLLQQCQSFVGSSSCKNFIFCNDITFDYAGSLLSLKQQVVSDILQTEPIDDNENNNNRKSLSRPERKARERAKKERKKRSNKNHRRHDYSQRLSTLQELNNPGSYDLHSARVSKLSSNSTADDVLKAIKRAQNYHDAHDIAAIENFLLEQTDKTFAYGFRGSLLSRLAVAALHMNNHRLARKAIQVRRDEHYDSMQPMESAAIIRGLLRVHNVSDAWSMLHDELSLPTDVSVILSDDENSNKTAQSKDRIIHHALSLASIVSRHFFEGEPHMAIYACDKLTELGPIVRNFGISVEEIKMPWDRIITGAAKCEKKRRDGSIYAKNVKNLNNNEENEKNTINVSSVKLPCNLVYAVLNVMTTFPSDNSDRTYELLSNALVRRVNFVTGAISMTTCPASDGRGEAAFIGRSNVGKSSLINMITNRKSLAFTGKRPGKTQQFNFFTVNDKVDIEKELKYGDEIRGEKDLDCFYLVDLPGFGYSKVPQNVKESWYLFMKEYISCRTSLTTVFHLIDSRLGPTTEDSKMMSYIGQYLPSSVSYVVVLTKADKNAKKKNKSPSINRTTRKKMQLRGKVSKDVLTALRQTMKFHKIGKYPVILSSSETKLGRDDLWRYLRLAAER